MKTYFLWLAKFCTMIFIFFFIVPMLLISAFSGLSGELGEKSDLSSFSSKSKVAVIELNGVIQNSKEIVRELHAQAKNKKVKGIVLRIDSPGGSVGPSQDIYSAVAKLKNIKPIVASMASVAASGGLYSALAADKIFAQPGTLTGSIGVIMQIPNFQKVADKVGVDFITIKSGKFKDVGNSFRQMTVDEKQFIQGTVDEVQKDFIDAVVSGRNLAREDVLKFADGRIIVGSKALEYGLIDKIGGVYDAAREVFNILGKPLKDNEMPALYYPEDKFGKFKKYLGALSDIPKIFAKGYNGHLELMYL